MTRQLKAIGAKVFEGPYHSKNPLTIYANAGRIAKIVRTENVSIIHARSRAPAWSSKWAAQRTGAKFVTTYAGIHTSKSALKNWYNRIMASGDIVIANSAFTAQHIRNTHPDIRCPIAVIPRGIDLASFDPALSSPEQITALRRKWGAPDNAKILFLPGRISRRKGIIPFIDAISMIQDTNVVGVLAGDTGSKDDFAQEVLDKIQAMGLRNRVFYVGHIQDMPLAYAASDLVICASIEPESFGRVAVEAQAMRKLVVSTDLGGAKETVLPDESGWLVKANDGQALGEAILEALNLPHAQAEAMRDRGRAHVMRRFAVQSMCAATLQVYAKLLGANGNLRSA